MKIIIAPAKKMRTDIAYMKAQGLPCFLEESLKLQDYMKTLSLNEIKKLLVCSDAIAKSAYLMYQDMDIYKADTPAILAFDGIQYQYMAPHLFEDEWFVYVQRHLRILSGFYGVLRPLDATIPYRLEINNSLVTPFCKSLYDFWKDRIYQEIVKDDNVILDLASAQHARVVKRYVCDHVRYVKCYFMEESDQGLKEKGVYVKMARGSLVRWMAEHAIEDVDRIKEFQELGYQYANDLSTEEAFVFVRTKQMQRKYYRNHKK